MNPEILKTAINRQIERLLEVIEQSNDIRKSEGHDFLIGYLKGSMKSTADSLNQIIKVYEIESNKR